MNGKTNKAIWKEMFSFSSGGRIKSINLMCSFALSFLILFFLFFCSNIFTIFFEKIATTLDRGLINIIDTMVPTIVDVSILLVLSKHLKGKYVMPMALVFSLAVVLIFTIALICWFEKDILMDVFKMTFFVFILPILISLLLVFRNIKRN